jgi:predicted transcriptional regulator
MGYTIETKNKQEEIIKKSIESNDKNSNNKIKNNSYENIKNIVSENNSIKHIKKSDNNTIKKTINIGL